MALSDADVQKIAHAVLNVQLSTQNDPTPHSVAWFIKKTYLAVSDLKDSGATAEEIVADLRKAMHG